MDYSEFKEILHNPTLRLSKKEYYNLLVYHSKDIVREVEASNQLEVSRNLNISPTKLSYIYKILEIIAQDYTYTGSNTDTLNNPTLVRKYY